MSYEIGTASNAADLLNKLNTFLTSKGKAFGAVQAGVGNGTISAWDGGASSISETFTLTATSATNFTVVGSVSGSLGNATVGTQFTHAKLTFMLTAGSTAFQSGDTFTINTCAPWTSLRSVAGSEMIWRAEGNDGARQIYVGAKLFSNAGADYYNLKLQGMTGYTSANTFTNQPGQIGATGTPVITLWNAALTYWFVANGQRVIIYAKVGVMYAGGYLGFFNTYLSPGQYPYPLFVGGNMSWNAEPAADSVNWRYAYSGVNMHAFWRGLPTNSGAHNDCSGRLRMPDGTYIGSWAYQFAHTDTNGGGMSAWPYCCENVVGGSTSGFIDIRENLDGSYPLLPIIFSSDRGVVRFQDTNTWGELDGVFATTGHANASENTIKSGLITHVVFQDTFRTIKDSFCAIALD